MMIRPYSLAAAVGAAFVPVCANAENLTISGTITATSDYVFRSVTFSDHKPALQPYVELSYGGAYAGIFASNVDFGSGDPNRLEIDYLLGYRKETAFGLSYDINYSRYTYDHLGSNGEINLALDYPLGDKFAVSSAFAYDPVARTLASQIGASYAISDKISLSGTYGHEELLSHNYWDFGITYAPTDNLSVDLRYFDTDDGQAFGVIGVTYAFNLLGG